MSSATGPQPPSGIPGNPDDVRTDSTPQARALVDHQFNSARPVRHPWLVPVVGYRRYGLAVVAVVLALLLTLSVEHLWQQPPTLLFLAAVILASLYGGLWAGLLASVLSIVALDYFFVGAIFSLRMELVDSVDFIAFAGISWLVVSLQSQWQRFHRRLAAMEGELQIARRIQQRLFPSQAPALPGMEVAGACFPADATGGDFFDYIPLQDGAVGVVVGDVSGHGLGPALVVALIHAYLRALTQTPATPGEILSRANHIVCQEMQTECFATVSLCQIDPQTRSLIYAGAGHESYLLDAAGERTPLRATGLPLGIRKDEKIESSPAITLRTGQIVLLLSDGIIESQAGDGSQFGLGRALEVVQARRHESARDIVAALCQAAQAHGRHAPQSDDMTVVVVKVR